VNHGIVYFLSGQFSPCRWCFEQQGSTPEADVVGPIPYTQPTIQWWGMCLIQDPNMNGYGTLFCPLLNDSKEVNSLENFEINVEVVLEVENSIKNIRNFGK
jgi:hypothetical protein